MPISWPSSAISPFIIATEPFTSSQTIPSNLISFMLVIPYASEIYMPSAETSGINGSLLAFISYLKAFSANTGPDINSTIMKQKIIFLFFIILL